MQVSCLLAALALVLLFSCPGAAAIKRFKDDKGTLHISNEGGEGKPPLTISNPPGRPSRVRGPGAHPRREPAPRPPGPAAPHQPENAPNKPAPPPGGHAPR
ncbi:MAG: hypothetical protein PHU44_07990 [Syntrophales bacterium]|nr:hypothetical protein [Syntrophales bacterium]